MVTIERLFIIATFALAAGVEQELTAKRLFFSGFLLGYAFISEYPAILIIGILMIYIIYRLIATETIPKFGWFVLGAAIVAVGWLAYNDAVFGSPFKLGYSESELWQVQHKTGFMSLTMPRLDALWGITFSPFRGLFFLSPWMLVCLPGFWVWYRAKKYRGIFWVALTSILAMFLFNISSVMWWGGFAVGPRYILPGLPFMVLAAVFFFRQWGKKNGSKWFTVVSMIWSLIAVWGLSLADQAFPSDTIKNPLLEYALPNWSNGNIARNLGTLIGLQRLTSLMPLFIMLFLIWAVWGWQQRRSMNETLHKMKATLDHHSLNNSSKPPQKIIYKAATERYFVAGVIVITLILTSLPYLYGYLSCPADKKFMGIMLDVPDHGQYFSWMRELAHAPLASNKLTPEPNRAIFFNLLWWMMGKLGKWLGLGLIAFFRY